MRLRIIRPGDRIKFICDPEHVDRMTKVVEHNGGWVQERLADEDGVYFTIVKMQSED